MLAALSLFPPQERARNTENNRIEYNVFRHIIASENIFKTLDIYITNEIILIT
jgi:hypothetical protein